MSASSNPSRGDGSGGGQTGEDWEGEPEEEVDHQTTALSRVLLDLLQDESYGAARGASPGGLAHVAAVAAAAAANNSQRAVLVAGHALPHLLHALKARLLHEIASAPAAGGGATTSAPAAAGGASAVAIAVTAKAAAAAAAAATPATVLQLQHVGGFEAVVIAVGRLLAGAASGPSGGGVDQALGGGGADAVVDREFLLAALKACPRQTADFLAHLVWCGRPPRSETVTATAAAATTVEEESVGNGPARGGTERELTLSGAGTGAGVGVGVGERALILLLEIVLDARRASSVPVAAATAATAAVEAAAGGAVDLRSGMGVLSRVLHLNDGAVSGRLEVALRKLEAAVRASEEEGSAQAGCDGMVYLTGKLVASLFVHLPEARPVLSRMSFFFFL